MASQLQNDVYNWMYGLGQKVDENIQYYGGPHLYQGLQGISQIAQALLPGSGYVEASDAAQQGDVGGVGWGLLGELPGGDAAKAIFLAPHLARKLDPVFPHRVEFDKSLTGKAADISPKGWENYVKKVDPESSAAERLFQDSGYFQDKQGNVLREIPDVGMSLNPINYPFSDKFMVNHPAGDVHSLLNLPPVEMSRSMQPGSGMFNRGTNEITLGGNPSDLVKSLNPLEAAETPYDILWALGHELNHAAQKYSGIEGGFNPASSVFVPQMWKGMGIEPNVDIADLIQKGLDSPARTGLEPGVSDALRVYRQFIGEQMAENSAARMMGVDLSQGRQLDNPNLGVLLKHPNLTLPYPENILTYKDIKRNIFD